jgi:hypothetical protein
MKTTRRISKKLGLGLLTAAAMYAGLWFVTETLGVPQVRNAAVQAMEQPVPTTDDSQPGDEFITGPVYRCSAGALAPFVVRAHHQWQSGMEGDTGSSVYLWFFGPSIRIRETWEGA